MPRKNEKQVSIKFKNKQEILQARKERDEAILKLKKALSEAKVKEREIIQLGKIEDEKFKEKVRTEKERFRLEALEQQKLIDLNRKDIKEEQLRTKEEINLQKENIVNQKRLYSNENKTEIALIREKVEAAKQEARMRMAELKQKDAQRKFELNKQIQEQKIKAAEIKVEADKMIAEKKREILVQREELKIKKAEGKSLLQSTKAQRLNDIREEQQRVKELEAEEKRKFAQREIEIKAGIAAIAIDDQIEINNITEQSVEVINEAQKEVDEIAIEREEMVVAPIVKVTTHDEESRSFSYESKAFDQDENQNEVGVREAEAVFMNTFGKHVAKLFIDVQQEPTTKGNKTVEKRNATIFNETLEFNKIISEEQPVSIDSIVLAANAILNTYSPEDEKHIAWQYTATLLLEKIVKFGKGFVVPTRVSNLRCATYTYDATEYSQFMEVEFEKFVNEIIAEKLDAGAAIQISKNLFVKKSNDEVRVYANSPYLLA